MKCEILMIGIGGEGVLSVGEILANAFIKKDFSVSMYPFYGSQQRGGEAGCILKIDNDSKEITNPTITSPDYYLVINDKYLDKYISFKHDSTKIIKIDEKYKNIKEKNMVVLKSFVNTFKMLDDDLIIECIKEKFKKKEVQEKNLSLYMR